MKITGREKIENCVKGEFVYRYFFDAEWTKESILNMAGLGGLKFYESFPRPMFKVVCPDGTIIKGVLRADNCRVIFPRSGAAAAALKFEAQMREIFQEPTREG
jgi:hypothetical protein